MDEILNTKLFIPRPRTNLVSRPHLIERLNTGQGKKLTLIAAPAGFGKTTLLSEWIPYSPHCVTWLSLDEGDNSPARFWMYFVAALQTISPELGRGAQTLLPSLQQHDIKSIITGLINEINAFGDSFVHVFDDYHLIDSTEIDHELAYLIDHQPSNLHLIITTREDPNLHLARLRARGQLTELRVVDLRFTPAEAAEFLNQVMDLNLSADDITELETRTEGWIAGLQLAALSMQGHQDVTGFIRAFAGDNRYIVDYLVEEVLQRQSECVRSFLLQTSILERLNGPLCDTVTKQLECHVLLEALERDNYFVIPLDDKRHWYRYHHLFGDVLRMQLMTEQPDQVPILHRRASEWYEQNDLAADAIHHALAGGDLERAAGLIERAAPAMRKSRQEITLKSWMKALPDELFRARPVLSIEYVGTLLSNGELEGVEGHLRDAERWLETTADGREPQDEMVVMDEVEFRRLPGSIAMYRAGLALFVGNVPDTVTYARQVLDLAPEDDHVLRGAASALLGLASWTVGDLDAAYRSYADGMASLQKAGNIADAVNGAITLATIRITQGHLSEAMSIYERALQLATEQGGPALAVRGAVDLYIGMSELHYEHNDLHTATHLLLRSKELGEFNGMRQNRYRWRVAMARIRQAQADLDDALDLLHEAERMYMSDFSPDVRPIRALKIRVEVTQGRLDEALNWAREEGLSADDNLSYLHEFEHITLARVLLARSQHDREDRYILESMGLLERLLKAAQEGGRTGSAIEILVLLALAHQMQGDIPSALPLLERALMLAEPEGYIRIFLDEGADMLQLLRETIALGIMPGYSGKLLAAFDADQQGVEEGKPRFTSLASSSLIEPEVQPAKYVLVEPLSQRELDILRLFKTELSGPEIANELVIALSTVRTHTKSIYSKLNVNSRRAAVRRAIELGLI
jgi:LuxR family transcriptional regulator, maltose regulon positive regulatory protein